MNYNRHSSYDPYYYVKTYPFMSTADTSKRIRESQSADKFTYPQNRQNALALIQQALAGETEDRMFYEWLIEQAPTEEERQIIAGIRDNEIGHFAMFHQLFYEITNMMPQQVQGEQFIPPESYCAGLAQALLGEQNAVQKYREILYAMQDRVHINMMIEITTDEIRHGILYNYLYAKNGCTA
ncbi:rubrerythrin [Anaerocolumna cellulosilytica]|uniref:Rubrerythrin n=1 Tax=Anaerocolumna cellulosilytica TaxID=433286 RepID=A0A6S6QQT7_9FIRM|nr:ferritin-like domain-containing protein [Anaerocolumna cellulosilytica]MBB5196007.1 rubrerythrin [Anaerocolumna cellulosilytica]BCJ93693.1 rubrerythrin [Anaerocolumna cellulosilytica]